MVSGLFVLCCRAQVGVYSNSTEHCWIQDTHHVQAYSPKQHSEYGSGLQLNATEYIALGGKHLLLKELHFSKMYALLWEISASHSHPLATG